MRITSIKSTRILLLGALLTLPALAVANTCHPTLSGPQPNLRPAVHVAVITGNAAADDRLRAIAESRGYRPQALLADEKELVFPWSVHRCAALAWQQLREAARREGYFLAIVSGYRSLARQRQIFLGKLRQYEVTPERIASGEADDDVHRILAYSALPGYSRHHSGFALDLQADSGGLNAFGTTAVYRWLAADQFQVARRHGFVPSYPDQAPNQGPVPEPWEFLYVGDTRELALATAAENDFLESARRILHAIDAAHPSQPVTARRGDAPDDTRSGG